MHVYRNTETHLGPTGTATLYYLAEEFVRIMLWNMERNRFNDSRKWLF